jgi:hypothetical protein
MNDDVHRFLDGDLPLHRLQGEERREAEAWERLVEAFRVESPVGTAPPWLEDRIMDEVHGLPARGPARRLIEWLLQPHPIRVSPLALGVVAAGVAAVLLLPNRASGPAFPVEGTSVEASAPGAVVYVQFVLEAPGASSVAVAGDFTGWTPDHALADPDGDGVWTGRIPVGPGVHSYMFVVNGSRWVTDPRAERYQDDGFGNRNAVLAVSRGAL